MKQYSWQIVLGWAVGMTVQAVLPGQRATGWFLASLLSLAGAVGGEVFAVWALPRDFMTVGGVLLTGMGAVASLLVEAVFCGYPPH